MSKVVETIQLQLDKKRPFIEIPALVFCDLARGLNPSETSEDAVLQSMARTLAEYGGKRSEMLYTHPSVAERLIANQKAPVLQKTEKIENKSDK